MIRRCPNCGCEVSDDANFCGNCGGKLDMDDEPIFSEFPDETVTAENSADGAQNVVNSINYGYETPAEPNYVATKIAPEKANKYKKEIFSWSIFILVASALGLIFNLANLEDTIAVQELLPQIADVYYGMFKTAVDVYYAGVVLLILLLAAGVAFLIFTVKLNKFAFPVQDEKVFGVASKAFYASVAVTVFLAALVVVEVIAVINTVKMQMAFDDIDLGIGTGAFSLIKDIIVLGGTALTMVFTLKIARSKVSA